MKYKQGANKEEINPFEEGQEAILTDLWNKFGVVKQKLQQEKLPPHDTNMRKKYEELFGVIVSIEEMIELRDFFENDYAIYLEEKLITDKKNGMTKIDPKLYT